MPSVASTACAPSPFGSSTSGSAPYRAELAGRLDSLERHLERTARPIPPKERSR